jgi:AcrR family transcriptional regulator
MAGVAAIEGLRARKKRETQAALAWAAVRLAVERGFANVPIEDIAAAAGVSARTFSNYFSSKAEAIVARHAERLRTIAAELRERPPDETLWAAIRAAVIGEFKEQWPLAGPGQAWIDGVKLMVAEPTVQAEFLRQSHIAEQDIAAAIADRIGGVADALYPQLAAAAVGTVIRVSLERWQGSPQSLGLPEVLEDAFDRMASLRDAPAEPDPPAARFQ